jgi:signal transduction histidine kinase
MTVVAGYIRMLLKERAGPIADQQRRLLEEAEKSCARLSALISEVGDLSALEGGTATFNRVALDLRSVLSDAIRGLPELPDREVRVELDTENGPAMIQGDATRLRTALSSVIAALRREVITSDQLWVHERTRQDGPETLSWIAIGDRAGVTTLAAAEQSTLTTFDEWRGGCGLSLPVARRIINAHGGSIWSPVEESKAGAVIVLPRAS